MLDTSGGGNTIREDAILDATGADQDIINEWLKLGGKIKG